MHDVKNRESRLFEYSLFDSWEGRIYQIEQLAEPRLFIQRGFHHEFYFSDGKRENRLRSDGQMLIEGDSAEYENNRYIVRLLKQIADILVPEGVDSRCFQLTYKKVYLPLAG